MHLTLLLPLLLTTLLPSALAATPDGLLVPFSTLPTCAATCGTLWDVQGACAPAAPVTDTAKSCFCSSATLVPFTVGGAVGDCCATAASDLQTVKDWFTGFCKNVVGTTTTAATTGTSTGTATGTGTSTSTSTSAATVKDTRTWIQSHYQWIIMAVVLLIAIVGSWVGAALLRKRYLAKRELGYELRPPHQPWVGTVDDTRDYGNNDAFGAGGGFGKEDEAVLGKKKKKWIVTERT